MERFFEELIVMVGVEVVIERSRLVLVMHRTPLLDDLSSVVSL